mgnify:CR=1 FL=1
MGIEPRHGHRDGIPVWGWLALGVFRVASLVPLLLLVAGLWWWLHGGAHEAPQLARRASQWAAATADSLFSR